jgi:hypothetical protein
VAKFESALAQSRAVIGRPAAEVDRLASNERQGYATYYQLVDAEIRLPDDNEWDPLRRMADAALFPGYEKQIRFAALSLDGMGIHTYGECFLVCKDAMIGHRASVFESNSAMFVANLPIASGQIESAVRGRRSTYGDRAVLCVAKLADRLADDTDATNFSAVLMKQGSTPAEDDFVEVNIYGPMTIRTIDKVIIHGARARRKAYVKSLRDRLAKLGVEFEVR